MILEGIVTSLDQNDELNVAPMGPIVDETITLLILRPFRSSRTFQNLKARPYGVFHVVDDVLLLARAAIGALSETPASFPAERITGRVLSAACRWYEFEIDACDESQERTELRARVVHGGRLRDFFGFNRAKHAVVEAAILATRVHILPRGQVADDFARLRTIVGKTAGPREHEAFQLLDHYVGSSSSRPSAAARQDVVVNTGARLHLGLLSHGAPGRREFGGVGLMIDRPGFVVRGRPAAVDELDCGSWKPRVAELLSRLRAPIGSGPAPGPLHLEIANSPPAHAGLGSGTQLGLSVAKICSIIAGESDVPVTDLARRACRGLRSAVGLYGFQQGGLIVEAGKRAAEELSPLAARVEFPAEWRFVLVRPRGASGISGTDEASGFSRLSAMPEALTDRLCRIALTEILPAVSEHDFARASESIGQFGRLVGEYFAPVQGGIFADEQMRRLAARLGDQGLHGVGQTSWGPTLFILQASLDSARQLATDLAHDPSASDCEFTIAAPLNRGAAVNLNQGTGF